jgi:hypothetical protein
MTGKYTAIVAILAALVAAPSWAEVDSEGLAEAGSVPAAQAAPSPEADVAPTSNGRVVRSALTTAVIDREPQDAVATLRNENVQILYFTEVRDATGDTITHRWEWMGRVVAEVDFAVRGPRWRVHSSKNLEPSWLGEWTVTAVDSSGRVLSQDRFTFSEASAPPAAPAP